MSAAVKRMQQTVHYDSVAMIMNPIKKTLKMKNKATGLFTSGIRKTV